MIPDRDIRTQKWRNINFVFQNKQKTSFTLHLAIKNISSVEFILVAQSCPTLCDPMNRACQASLSITIPGSSLKLTSIQLVMPSSHLILCCLLLLLPRIPPSIRVFSKESTLHKRWLKYWSFSFSISSFSEHSGLISFRMD